MGHIETHTLANTFFNARLKMFYQMWNLPHAWGKIGNSGVQAFTPAVIYSHSGLINVSRY